jgi:hypothetical protein
VGGKPRRSGGDGGREGARGKLVGKGLLPTGDWHGIADVDEGGRYHRSEQPSRERPPHDESREVRRQGREETGHNHPEQRKAHHPHPPESVGKHAPHRLHQTVEQEVQASRGRDLCERDPKVGSYGHQHRGNGEAVERAQERRRPQQPQRIP